MGNRQQVNKSNFQPSKTPQNLSSLQRRITPPAQQEGGQSLEEMREMRQRFEATGSTWVWGHNGTPETPPDQVQAKLTIGEVGDKYEQEADTVAADVVKKINAPTAPQPPNDGNNIQRQEILEEELQMHPMLQRNGGVGGGATSEELEQKIDSARGSGQSLDPDLQSKMGDAMGADFSGVKIHTDSQSDQLNRSIQAKAFATGQDVFFRQGAYAPQSESGQELIAHELTHVVQQGGAGIQAKPNLQAKTIPPEITLEQSSNKNLKAIARQPESSPKISHLAAKTIQREVLLDPGLVAEAGNRTPVYQEEAVEDSQNAQNYHLGNLTQKEKGLAQETGEGDWLKFTFEKVNDEGHKVRANATLHNGNTIGEGFVHKPWVTYGYLDRKGVAGHGKQKDDPLFQQSESGDPIISPDDVKQGGISDCMLMAALVKLADKEPSSIQNMITDNGNTVSVRLYREGSPEIVTVRKTVLKKSALAVGYSFNPNVTPGQRKRVGAHGPVLWPAMIEKAYAKFHGSYENIAPGPITTDPYTALTGRELKREKLFEVFDFRGTVQDLKDNLNSPEFAQDHQKWQSFVNTKLGDILGDEIHDPGLSDFEGFLTKAGVSSRFKSLVIEQYGAHFDQGIETGDYTDSTLVGFARVKAILDRGEYISTGTRNLSPGKKGRGHSGGEDIDTVPGIAAPHAYAIIGYSTENRGGKDIHYLRVRNPWGHTGMKYENGQRAKIEEPEFNIELADARRLFGEKGGWRYTETRTEDLIAKAQDYHVLHDNLNRELANNLYFHKDKLETERNSKEVSIRDITEQQRNSDEERRLLQEEIDQLNEEMLAISEQEDSATPAKQKVLERQYLQKQKQYDKKTQRMQELESVIRANKYDQVILGLTQEIEGIEQLIFSINQLLETASVVDENPEQTEVSSMDAPDAPEDAGE